jgi:hypothetical protein
VINLSIHSNIHPPIIGFDAYQPYAKACLLQTACNRVGHGGNEHKTLETIAYNNRAIKVAFSAYFTINTSKITGTNFEILMPLNDDNTLH